MLLKIIYILLINLITFGGGPVYIPIYEQFYTYFQLATPEEYLSIVAISNAFPGVTGGKLAGLGLYIDYGMVGTLIASIAFAVPGILTMLVAVKSLEKIKKTKQFEAINKVTKPIIIGILLTLSIEFLIKSTVLLNGYMLIFYSILLLVLYKFKVNISSQIYIFLFTSLLIEYTSLF